MLRAVLGKLVQTTDGKWMTRPPTSCPNGHQRPGPQSSWAGAVEANMDLLKGSPVVLVGTAAQCAQQLLEWHERFGITDWHLGPDVDATSRILECLSPNGYS